MQMYRFTVHGVQRSKTRPSYLVLAVYTFGHKDLQTCRTWMDHINASLKMETARPKSLLVRFNIYFTRLFPFLVDLYHGPEVAANFPSELLG